MLHIFYAKYPDIALHVIRNTTDQKDSARLTWTQASVQLCSNVHMDDVNTLIFVNQEFQSIYECRCERRT